MQVEHIFKIIIVSGEFVEDRFTGSSCANVRNSLRPGKYVCVYGEANSFLEVYLSIEGGIEAAQTEILFNERGYFEQVRYYYKTEVEPIVYRNFAETKTRTKKNKDS